jgi:hypothetical protein
MPNELSDPVTFGRKEHAFIRFSRILCFCGRYSRRCRRVGNDEGFNSFV